MADPCIMLAVMLWKADTSKTCTVRMVTEKVHQPVVHFGFEALTSSMHTLWKLWNCSLQLVLHSDAWLVNVPVLSLLVTSSLNFSRVSSDLLGRYPYSSPLFEVASAQFYIHAARLFQWFNMFHQCDMLLWLAMWTVCLLLSVLHWISTIALSISCNHLSRTYSARWSVYYSETNKAEYIICLWLCVGEWNWREWTSFVFFLRRQLASSVVVWRQRSRVCRWLLQRSHSTAEQWTTTTTRPHQHKLSAAKTIMVQ